MTSKVNVRADSSADAGAKVDELREQALQHAEHIATRVHHKAAPVSRPFVRSGDSGVPPLVQCLRGGRGGEVRLKLYLSIIWLARKPPHDTPYPARFWTELLALPDPAGNGSRRVTDAITWLTWAGFLRVKRQLGQPSVLYLLDDGGTRAPYQPPHKLDRPYVQIPEGFWTKGWHCTLSGAAVALLLVMLDQHASPRAKGGFWLSPSRAKDLYALSPDSWTRGTAELAAYGLVDVLRQPVSPEFGWRRLRNIYRLNAARLETPPFLQTGASTASVSLAGELTARDTG